MKNKRNLLLVVNRGHRANALLLIFILSSYNKRKSTVEITFSSLNLLRSLCFIPVSLGAKYEF